ncbi:alanine or glycine:cation symporter, AGCS family [Alteribacillus bidgolensis]|uniref:Alanine or glycine:cation symporter, AGCS family n=1 Tax=Alteribacillus bidgolensis TaxID=930129 RepID=A0A1G8HE53_9BACI|nr:alanine or glycine:cation symporter, AGCS family [Alteribacillus bidgolensis]
MVESLIDWGNTILWSYVLIALLVGLGIYFTFRTKFVQVTNLIEMFRLMKESPATSNGNKQISSFGAFCISAASRIGTGNLAGVAIAITLGGPGAVFWMWVVAIFSAVLCFIESTLAQVYKVKETNGFKGGPAYYMEKAIGARWMGVMFALFITFCFGLAFNSVQANTITVAFEEALGTNRLVIGMVLTAFVGFVIFGGVKRIAKVSQVIVPVLALLYLILVAFIVIVNIGELPRVIGLIVTSAFGLNEAVAGGIGVAIMNGVKRGLFSNEAGMGSAPVAAATADVSHPAKQGFVQTLGAFVDTLLICSATAFIILLSGIPGEGIGGIQLTQSALASHVGPWANIFVAIAILLFCFSSIIGNYYYGESNIGFINKNKALIFVFRLAVLGMLLFGSVSSMSMVWNVADLFMALMAITNLIALALIGKIAIAVLKDYLKQKKQGKEPVFYASNIKGLKNVECWKEEKIKKRKEA